MGRGINQEVGINIYIYIHIDIYILMHIHIHILTLIHIHILMHMHILIHIHIQTLIHIHILIHIRVQLLGCVQLVVTLWTAGYQGPLTMVFPRPRILEWVAISSFRGSSQPRDRTHISCYLLN